MATHWGIQRLDPMGRQPRPYKYMEPLAFCRHLQYNKKEKLDTIKESEFWHQFEQAYHEEATYLRSLWGYKTVGYSAERQRIQEDKMDVPKVLPSNQAYKIAIEYTWEHLRDSLIAPLTPYPSLVPTAGSGFPYNIFGAPTKQQAVQTEEFKTNLAAGASSIPQTTPKQSEELSEEDLAEQKMRIFESVPTHTMVIKKYFFDGQNDNLKRNYKTLWTKYGFVKQFGGFDALAKFFEAWPVKFDGDLSRYDKTICLQDTYDLRFRGLMENDAFQALWNHPDAEQASQFRALYNRVVSESVKPVVACMDGVIYRRQCGNNSGDPNTTTDNSIAHTIMAFYNSILYFEFHFGRYPTYEEVMDNFSFAIFSDDFLGATTLVPDEQTFLINTIINGYADFGMKLKFLNVHIGDGFNEKSEFLGNRFLKYVGYYFPVPRLKKLMVSLAINNHKQLEHYNVQIQKLYAIWNLCYCYSLPPAANPQLLSCLQVMAKFLREKCDKMEGIIGCDLLELVIKGKFDLQLILGVELQANPPPEPVSFFFHAHAGRRNKLIAMNNSSERQPIPRKARAILNRLLATKQITPGGLAWLVAATDPFHDGPLEVTGYPDANQSNSLVQIVQKTVNISRPSGLDANTSWDAHVFFAPVSPSTTSPTDGTTPTLDYIKGSLSQGGAYTQTNSLNQSINPGYNVIALQSGLNWQTTAFTSATTNDAVLQLPIDYCAGQFRLVFAAVEVVNTTSALYQSGACSAYRIPSALGTASINVANQSSDHMANIITLPPGSQSQAVLMPSTRTWAATKGLYSVSVQNNLDNRLNILGGRSTNIFVAPYTSSELKISGTSRPCWSQRYQTIGVTPASFDEPYNMSVVFPYDINGAVFSGLNPNTTLQVTVKYGIERIPGPYETDLAPLARTPPGYDPMIMEIYSRVMSELPVGCTVDENPLGEWFNDILKGIEVVAPAVGLALAPFTGGASEFIGMGVSGLAAATSAGLYGGRQRQPETVKQEIKKEVKKDVQKIMKGPVTTQKLSANKNKRKRRQRQKAALKAALKKN